MKLSCVILTMGSRPAELDRAVASAMALGHGACHGAVEVVVVGNGADVPSTPPGVMTVRLPGNVGVAAGRNAGVAACGGDVVLFLDDDGWYPDPGLSEHVASRFAADPALAVLSFRVADPGGGPGARWHVPRLRAGDPGRSSVVTTFAGGASAIRRSAYQEAGGLPAQFFYGHEETDLAWRLLGLGYRLEYDAAARICHPALPNARHADLVPAGWKEPGAARAQEPALAPGRGIPAGLAGADRPAGAVSQHPAGLAGRIRRGLADGSGGAAATVGGHCLADDPRRASSRYLRDRDLFSGPTSSAR